MGHQPRILGLDAGADLADEPAETRLRRLPCAAKEVIAELVAIRRTLLTTHTLSDRASVQPASLQPAGQASVLEMSAEVSLVLLCRHGPGWSPSDRAVSRRPPLDAKLKASTAVPQV